MHRQLAIVALTLLLSFALNLSAAEPLRNRQQFITALNKVENGMPAAEVLKLLGKPDDIRTRDDTQQSLDDANGNIPLWTLELSHHHWEEIWCYGTSHHLASATLGEIAIKGQTVQQVRGKGTPPPEGLFVEQDLREILNALAQTSRAGSYGNYNPGPVIRAVNLLQPLGKEKALAAIDEFIRPDIGQMSRWANFNGLNFVLLTLFEVPQNLGNIPDVGLWHLFDESERKQNPRFPVFLQNDIPFVFDGPRAWGSSGPPGGNPARDVAWFREHCEIRSKPLVPPDNPFAIFPDLVKAQQIRNINFAEASAESRAHITSNSLAEQLLRLLRPVYRGDKDNSERLKPPNNLKPLETRIAEASKLSIRWDPKSNQYTFLDGKTFTKSEPLRNRQQFITALNKIEEEMSEADVLKLLGKPDDIRTREDHGGINWPGIREIWRYGTSGHLTPATLGEVIISEGHKVRKVIGQGETIPGEMVEEPQLRALLDALGQIEAQEDSGQYNPLNVIRAVNLLQPLGKEKALAVIEEFIHRRRFLSDNGDTVNFVMRSLFDVPADPGYFPEMGLWDPLEDEAQRKLFPRHPIILVEDIPFCVGKQADLGGAPLNPPKLVPYFRRHGVIRKRKLSPIPNPFLAIQGREKFPRQNQDRGSEDRDWSFLKQSLEDQIFELLKTVYQVGESESDEPSKYEDLKNRKTRIEEASKLVIRWDPIRNQYTFPDGKSLSPPDLTRYRRSLWKIPDPVAPVELAVERQSRHEVDVSLDISYPTATVTGRVFNIGGKGASLGNFTIENNKRFEGGRGSAGLFVKIDEGEQLQAEVTVNGQKYLSPVFKP